MDYSTAFQLKKAGFDQKTDKLYAAEDFEGMNLRDIVDKISRVEGQHRTFDYSIYPEPIQDDWSQGKARNSYYFSHEYLNSEEGKKYTVYYPTLSELIEAIGDRFHALEQKVFKGIEVDGGKWIAYSNEKNDLGIHAHIYKQGESASEAVANLWLSLYNK